jgi:hypothetical protein
MDAKYYLMSSSALIREYYNLQDVIDKAQKQLKTAKEQQQLVRDAIIDKQRSGSEASQAPR